MKFHEIVSEGMFDFLKTKQSNRLVQQTKRQKDAAAWNAQVQAAKKVKIKPRPAKVKPKVPLKHGITRTASDGQTYRLDVGRGGDMIWFNVTTGAEADPAIDAELMK
jgi:hypothetical protein